MATNKSSKAKTVKAKAPAAKKSSKLVTVESTDKFNVCPEGESMNLWGVPFTFDGKSMTAQVSKTEADAMKAAGRVK